MSRVTAIWELYFFFGVMVSIGMSGSFIPPATTIATWFVRRRALATAIFVSGASFGGMIMSPIANWLIFRYGWRISYIIIGIAALILVALSAPFLKHRPKNLGQSAHGINGIGREGPDGKVQGLSLHQAIQTVQFWLACVIMFCAYFCQFTVLVHLVPHAIDLGIPASNAANLLGVSSGVAIAGRLLIGFAGDRIGNRLTIILCFAVLLIAFTWLLVAREF